MIINSDFFKVKSNNIHPHKGCIMTSEPFFNDNHFKRSVVLIVDIDISGGMGIVLNKDCNITLNSLIDGLNCDEEIPLFCGGPLCHDRLFYIHRLGTLIPGSIEIADNLYIDGDFEILSLHSLYFRF